MEIYNSIDRNPRVATNYPYKPTHTSRFFTEVTEPNPSAPEEGVSDAASKPPWVTLLQESPGRQRPYYNPKTLFDEALLATGKGIDPNGKIGICPKGGKIGEENNLKPLSSEWIINENRGSQIDLGKHRGANLKNRHPKAFYTPPEFNSESACNSEICLSELSGDWRGVSLDMIHNPNKSNPGCALKENQQKESSYQKFEDENTNNNNNMESGGIENGNNQANVESSNNQASGEGDTNDTDGLLQNIELEHELQKTWTLLNERFDFGRLEDWRLTIYQLFELQYEQHKERKFRDEKEKLRLKHLAVEKKNAENAVGNQEKLDRRHKWISVSPSPGPGERHPVLNEPNEAGGIYQPLLYGIFTDGGKTLPPHFGDHLNEKWKRWENINRFTDLNKPVSQTDKPLLGGGSTTIIGKELRRKWWNRMSSNEKNRYLKLQKILKECHIKNKDDALKSTVGYLRRERINNTKDTELAKWMRNKAGEIEKNTFYDLCGGLLGK